MRISVGLQPRCNNILHKNSLSRASLAPGAVRVSWQEAFYGFCMSLNVAFLALVYYPEAEEAFSSEVKSSSLSPIAALFPLAALLVLNVQAMEKLWKNVEMQTDIFRQ